MPPSLPSFGRGPSPRPGRNTPSVPPTWAPYTSAPHLCRRNSSAARWLSLSPPLWPRDARFPRMWWMWTGIDRRADSVRATRTSWPPPSSVRPSSVTRPGVLSTLGGMVDCGGDAGPRSFLFLLDGWELDWVLWSGIWAWDRRDKSTPVASTPAWREPFLAAV